MGRITCQEYARRIAELYTKEERVAITQKYLDTLRPAP